MLWAAAMGPGGAVMGHAAMGQAGSTMAQASFTQGFLVGLAIGKATEEPKTVYRDGI